MVIIKIWGGIGNQLFQYVFGEYLKQRYKQTVYYDINSFKNVDALRRNELDALNINIDYYEHLSFTRFRGVKNRMLKWIWSLNPRHHFYDENSVIPSVFDTTHTYFFQGYWQKIDYYLWLKENVPGFSVVSRVIPPEINNLFNTIMQDENSASLHVRRGDYFSPALVDTFGICDENYYMSALNHLLREKPKSRIYVFSDDLDWVSANLKLPENSVLIPNYSISQFSYIELMSKCRNHIISNSSFSWWGAVLNTEVDSLVIAPSQWQKNSSKTLVIDSWTKIKVD